MKSNSLFTPTRPEWAEIGRKLNADKGKEHLGKQGALALAEHHVLPCAHDGDARAMMLMANTYYTLAGAVGAESGLLNKLQAVRFLHFAKEWATRAFLTVFQTKDLHSAIRQADVSLVGRKSSLLAYGDIHILMSCYVQWAAQVKKRLFLPVGHETEIAKSCYTTLVRSPDETIQVLGVGTLLSCPGIPSNVAERCKYKLHGFLRQHVASLMRDDSTGPVDQGLVQAVCRVARVLGEFDTAEDIAEKYGLADQAAKARKRS